MDQKKKKSQEKLEIIKEKLKHTITKFAEYIYYILIIIYIIYLIKDLKGIYGFKYLH